MLKFRFSEKATKIWKNLPVVLTCALNFKKSGRFFQIVWPSHNILTLRKILLIIFMTYVRPNKLEGNLNF